MRSTVYREGASSSFVYPAAIFGANAVATTSVKCLRLNILCRPFCVLANAGWGVHLDTASSILAPSTQILWAGTLANFVAKFKTKPKVLDS